MQNILKNTDEGDSTPWMLLLILGGYVLAALFLFSFIAQGLIMLLFNYDVQESLGILTNPYGSESAKLPLMIIQAVTSIGAFIVVPLFFIKVNLKGRYAPFFNFPEQALRPILMTVVILFCFMVANSVVIEWNQNVDMPDIFSWFENWAQSKEAQLEKLTEYLTTFSGIHEYLIALVVIALIPAVGEELLFRGLIQNLFGKAFNNPHVAIWLSAIIFGIFHFQFYGVVPRVFLGALFGYLYYWSGYLSLAMVGHFINNGLTLTLLYFSQIKFINYNPAETDSSPPLYVVGIFFLAGAVLLYLFRNLFPEKNA
ncbi:CPBP family intramembrane glutamic endopeptidase [Marinoscillum luteum]|uniref:CPBP family intramembrane glutamic endopeptidase n=1 Tax=Marinoscillum luteum TaxID=861051 RepID=A0ABW7NC54_9BACT